MDKLNARRTGCSEFALNKYADLTVAEFKARFNAKYAQPATRADALPRVATAAPAIDWRDAGAVSPVKDQDLQNCGSCYAFAMTGAVEGVWALAGHTIVELSPSELVDCSGAYGDQGFNGGMTYDAYDYVLANGVCSEEEYPYVAEQNGCKADGVPKTNVSIVATATRATLATRVSSRTP